MANIDQMVKLLNDLSKLLTARVPGATTTVLVTETARDLAASNGAAATGILQQFQNRAAIVKMSEDLQLTAPEQSLWEQVLTPQQLGNNLWGAHL